VKLQQVLAIILYIGCFLSIQIILEFFGAAGVAELAERL
jgi:hypothetical protein